jgi:hypothetical protein
MSDEKKKRRELQRKVDLTNEELVTLRAQSTQEQLNYDARLKLQRSLFFHKQQLEIFESRTLLRKARQSGIEIPRNPAWWSDDNEDGGMPPEAVTTWLSEVGRIGVTKLIREESRRNIEWWVKVAIPLLSALTSLLGLLVALVTVLRNSPAR